MKRDIESVGGGRVPCRTKLRDQVIEAFVTDLGWRTRDV
jgi:hypothetical protein